VQWEKVEGPRAVTAFVIATAFGAGLFPFAPGTMGSLAGLPLAYFTAAWPTAARVALWGGLLVAGVWAAKVFDEVTGSSDNQHIVIDEVIGLGISAWSAGRDPKALIAAFVLFRFFDIVKPPPVRQLDRWSKKRGRWWGGFGVIADDVAAGLMALAVVVALQRLHILL